MKVSVITIVYNNTACIESCIQSVLNQSYSNIEHIIIDGGSTDGTQDKIKPYLDEIAFFKSEKDNGLYDGLNKGIRQATGDVVGILHSDDMYYDVDAIKKVVDAFQHSNADLVYAKGVYVDKEDINKVKRIYPSSDFKKRFLNFGWIPLHTTIYVKQAVFKKYGYYEEGYTIASDYEISLRWFQENSIKKYYLNEWIVKMRLGGKSTTPSLQKRKSSEDLRIINNFKLLGVFTLACKILQKVPQYLMPKLMKFKGGE